MSQPTPSIQVFSEPAPDFKLSGSTDSVVPQNREPVPSRTASSSRPNNDAISLSARLGVYSSLLLALRAKHAPTAAHCVRVAQSITAWGLHHEVSSEELRKLELVGLLHDIGKIGIPERILQKSGRLEPEERAIVDLHPRVGVEILRSANLDSFLIESIEQIGIWFDQSNRKIPGHLSVAQRILSIADAFDAMTSEQVYRPAMSVKHALCELERMGGTQFDPNLVSSFRDTVLGFKNELAHAVSQRWGKDSKDVFVHLFETSSNPDWHGSVAIESLNSVFHQNMMNRMNDGVIFIDTEKRILEWNQAATRLTGLKRSTLLHSNWSPDLIGLCDEHGNAVADEDCPIKAVLSTHKTSISRFRIQARDGRLLMIESQAMPIFDEQGTLRGGAMLIGDASDKVSMEEKMVDLHKRATQDPLTKIANRSELNRQMKQLVDQCQSEKIEASVLICDIDFFKRINDTFGHAAGDEALVVFANVLKEISRQTDFVARYGGEEFVILCTNCDLKSAVQIGESIRSKLRETPLSALKGKTMTASYGVSQILVGDDTDSALERADQGLLQAKQTGRDRVVAVEPPKAESKEISECEEGTTSPATSKASWFDWLGMGESKAIITSTLLTNFPRDIVTEKLKGFVSDFKAELVSVEKDRVELRVDTRFAPIQRRESDRPIVLGVTVSLKDFELTSLRQPSTVQQVMELMLDITPARNRDRRTDNLIDQANRIRHGFVTYLSAYEVTDSIRERMIPVYSAGADGR